MIEYLNGSKDTLVQPYSTFMKSVDCGHGLPCLWALLKYIKKILFEGI